jgi:hypothetical protein
MGKSGFLLRNGDFLCVLAILAPKFDVFWRILRSKIPQNTVKTLKYL